MASTTTLTAEEDAAAFAALSDRDKLGVLDAKKTVSAAFDSLFRRHGDRVYNVACRVLGDRNLAADVTQDTFVTVLAKAGRFDFRAAFSTWIYRIAVNRCIDVRRKRGRHRPLSLSDPDVTGWAEGSARDSDSVSSSTNG